VHSAWFSWWRTGHRLRLPGPPAGLTLGEGLETFDATPSPAGAAASGSADDA